MNPLVPKPGTAYQWLAMEDDRIVERKIARMRSLMAGIENVYFTIKSERHSLYQALLSLGDAHAMQGDGEVTLTALETSVRGTVQVFVRKGMRLNWPRAETPTHYIAMGLHTDLDEAAKLATREAIPADYMFPITKGLPCEPACRQASR